jgi:Spx/MgsR family transcriptional regulator
MIIYGIKNCDSVKKALKYMKEQQLEYEFVDFKITPVDKEKISSWLKYQSIDKLFNSRSTTYRNLKLKELGLDEASKVEWMSKENLLIKRPVIELDDKVVVGFNFDEYDKILT